MTNSDRPNVLLIATDHWPASLLGGAGHPVIRTPTLDWLAASGRRFTNCYSECPVCIPARRTLMTGTSPRFHGDRAYSDHMMMPEVTTLAQAFRNAGYQANAVGKLHVYPQRDRIGFDDVILHEEGRIQYGTIDDYEIWLADQGYPGQAFGHGLSNNGYETMPWHLPDHTHPTEWATDQMCRTIRRRDPKRPGFWYLSYAHPHPPLAPLTRYLDLYRDLEIPDAVNGAWREDPRFCPWDVLNSIESHKCRPEAHFADAARRAFYALCTQIDFNIRRVIGTLNQEGLTDNTIIAFTSDHGDMLGDHGLWAKRTFYEGASNVPLILLGASGNDSNQRVGLGQIDDRILGLQDLMPTLLDLADIEIPDHVEGISALADEKRDYLYGEVDNPDDMNRMIRQGDWKLIYHAVGNHRQLFNLKTDPRECTDLAADPDHQAILDRLTDLLISELYGTDLEWVKDDQLVGLPRPDYTVKRDHRRLNGQRGPHWPPPADNTK